MPPRPADRPAASALAKPLIITMGEPSGIGPDLIIQTLLSTDRAQRPPVLITGDVPTLKARCRLLGHDPDEIMAIESPNIGGHDWNSAPLFVLQTTACAVDVVPGHPDPANAGAVIDAIAMGVRLIKTGIGSALVTCPIQKSSLYSTGFDFPGHTEFLAALSEELFDVAAHPVMMIHTPELSTIPVTIHTPLNRVPKLLTADLIEQTCRTAITDLRTRFGHTHPRLAVAGLNPHAGEDRSLGAEDADIIAPAIERLKSKGHDVTGPLPADTMFHPSARSRYDAAICMYHDQALIPAKTLYFDEGVNVTLGLPLVRTSPDHGTALDLAGSGQARTTSFEAAIALAARMAQRAEEPAAVPVATV